MRLSSSDPNLQNIPVRTEFGRRIRGCFVPLRTGDLFMSADYSQIELRLLAHLSRDEHLVHAFCSGAGGFSQWIRTYGCEYGTWKTPEDWGISEGVEGNYINKVFNLQFL